MSPSVHVRLDAFSVLRRAGVHPSLLRTLTQLRLRRVGSGDRVLILDAEAVPAAGSREPWLRALLRDPRTHLVTGREEAVAAATDVVRRYGAAEPA